ncbi:hypothetical protein [Treponema zioleckii]|nr:hypothetical protein [Treponema zioleckii]
MKSTKQEIKKTSDSLCNFGAYVNFVRIRPGRRRGKHEYWRKATCMER